MRVHCTVCIFGINTWIALTRKLCKLHLSCSVHINTVIFFNVSTWFRCYLYCFNWWRSSSHCFWWHFKKWRLTLSLALILSDGLMYRRVFNAASSLVLNVINPSLYACLIFCQTMPSIWWCIHLPCPAAVVFIFKLTLISYAMSLA